MSSPGPTRTPIWRKSRRSGGSNNCVEVATLTDAIGVRDSKDQQGPYLVFTPGDWAAFVRSVQQ